MRLFLSLLLSLFFASCAVAPQAPSPSSQFLSENEYDVVSLVSRASKYFAKGRYLDAELYYRLANYLRPSDSSIQAQLASTLGKQGLYEESELLFDRLLARSPRNVTLRNSYASLLIDRGDYERAFSIFEENISLLEAGLFREEKKLLPQQIQKRNALIQSLYRNHATLAFRLGDEQDALCSSLVSHGLLPGPLEMKRHGKLLLGLELPEVVVSAVGEVGPATPGDTLRILALAQYSLGDCPNALDTVERIIEQKIKYPQALSDALWVRALCTFEQEKELFVDDEEKRELFFEELAFTDFAEDLSRLYKPDKFLVDVERVELERPGEPE